jgi:hypothetical protein
MKRAHRSVHRAVWPVLALAVGIGLAMALMLRPAPSMEMRQSVEARAP